MIRAPRETRPTVSMQRRLNDSKASVRSAICHLSAPNRQSRSSKRNRSMGFFAEFNQWLNAILATYIGGNTARIAAALEPAIVTLGGIYVIVWGYLALTGRLEEPVVAGIKRIVG